MSIGKKLRSARKALGISQEELAERLSVTTQAVSAWERDEYLPETKKLLAVGQVLRLSLDDLASEDDLSYLTRIVHPASILDKAIAYAAAKHSGAVRKGTKVPYIVHPMEVAAIVSSLTDDEEILAAAVLHDVLEDTPTTREELEKAFNKRIASLVADESENKREGLAPAATWRQRKAETIAHLREAGPEARIIALGDKLANIRAIGRDLQMLGDALWERFNEHSKANQGWYYLSVLKVLAEDETLAGTPCLNEFYERVLEIFQDVLTPDEGDDDSVGGPDEAEGLVLKGFTPESYKAMLDKSPEKVTAWALILDPPGSPDQTQLQIMAMIYDHFMRSEDIGFADTHLVITNDPDAGTPTWERTPDGYAIHLCAQSAYHWSQVGYQLGYAMTHCLIDHLHPDGQAVLWAEELISEAGTLYLLKMLSQNWEKTPFGQEDPGYRQALAEYIDANLSDRGTGALIRCPDREALSRLNTSNCFDDRINESHDLFSKMDNGDLIRLADVRSFAADDLLLYTRAWRRWADNSQAIEYICRLQEQIPGCDLKIGVPIEISLSDTQPDQAQRQLYEGLIRHLRILPNEYIVFNFLDDDKGDGEQIGLVFYQVTRERDGCILAEMRLDTIKGRKMYRIRCDDDRAVGFLNDILTLDAVPDTADWQDVTKEIFG